MRGQIISLVFRFPESAPGPIPFLYLMAGARKEASDNLLWRVLKLHVGWPLCMAEMRQTMR